MTPGTKAPYDSRIYFASFQELDFGKRLLAKVDESESNDLTTEVRGRIAHAYRYYYGFDNNGMHGTSSISRAGEQGELAAFRVNHARAVVNTLMNLIISDRVVWVPKATNIDYESLKQVEVAKAVLEYYWLERRVESLVNHGVEEALSLSEGFVLGLWDEFAGEDVEDQIDPSVIPDLAGGPPPQQPPQGPAMLPGGGGRQLFAPPPNSAPPGGPPPAPGGLGAQLQPEPELDLAALAPKKKGDFTFENVSTWDVHRDPNKKSWDALEWVSVRVSRNKFSLAAQYPEHAEEILDCTADMSRARTEKVVPHGDIASDDILVELFFHKRTPAMPQGREAMVLPNGTVIRDGALTYDSIPLFRIAPAELIGSPYGYTQFFEILAIQELIDSLHSTAATNLTTFATQNIFLPGQSEIQADQLSGGVRIIQGGPDGKEPKALQLCATPAELYAHLKDLKQDLELVFGVNAIVRGQLQSEKMSGSALALLETQVKQQSSSLAGSYRVAIQSIGDFVVAEMRKRASTERTVNLIGKDNAFLVVKEQPFTGDNFKAVKRVLVDIGNPLSQSVYGRQELAKDLKQQGLVNNLEQYFMVLDTGRTEPITEALTSELLLIKSENEQISGGQPPQVMLHDNHLLHGREHRSPVASPQARQNPAVLQASIEHMHQHYEAYFGTPPMVPQVDPMTGQPAVDPSSGQPALVPAPDYRTKMLVLMGMQPPDPALGAPPPGMGGPPPGAGGPPQGPNQNLAAGGNAPGPAPQPPPQDAKQNTPDVPGTEPGQHAKLPKMPDLPKNPATNKRWNPNDGSPPAA